MKRNIIVLGSFALLFIIVALIARFDPEPMTEAQLINVQNAVDKVFASRQSAAAPSAQDSVKTESIMAVIYRQPDSTWFIKARGATALLDAQSKRFSQLFYEELQFIDGAPDFSNIPQQYHAESTQPMRVATFNLNGLEVSVSRLSATQNIQANIQRWREQLQLPPSAPQFVKPVNNGNTILVRLNQAQPQATTAPQKEKFSDFAKLSESSTWSVIDSQEGMASALLEKIEQNNRYQVAVLRLPASVPQETILGIWKERAGVNNDATLPQTDLISQYQQTWTLFEIATEQQTLLIAMNQGQQRYTFLRLGATPENLVEAQKTFQELIDSLEIVKN